MGAKSKSSHTPEDGGKKKTNKKTAAHRKMGAKSKYSENFSASSVAEEMSSFRSGLQAGEQDGA